jgi:hypothetical protein
MPVTAWEEQNRLVGVFPCRDVMNLTHHFLKYHFRSINPPLALRAIKKLGKENETVDSHLLSGAEQSHLITLPKLSYSGEPPPP